MAENQNQNSNNRLLLIGWDAADWRVIMPLIEAGKMPNLQALIERGVMGNLSTLNPVLSPMLWTSIATGKRPYKHGVHGFSEPDPVTGGVRPVTNLSRKTKAIWNILHQKGKFPAVVGWWPSHPCEPMDNGVMVSNHYQRANGKDFESWKFDPASVHPERLQKVMKEVRFHPSEIEQDLATLFIPHIATVTEQEELDKIQDSARLKSLYKIIADTTTIHSAATAIIQNEPWDFMAVYHDAIDHFGHGFMKYHPPKREWISEEEFALWKDVTESGYRYADMQLGVMLKLAGEDTTVILMSDHGFHPDELRLKQIPDEPAGPAAEHRQLGILVAAGPGIRKDERIYGASLLDITPTILHHFGLPIGEDMDGRVLHDLWEEDTRREHAEIPSWDQVEGDSGVHPEGTQISPADSKAALDQLAALGYIEEPDEDKSLAMEKTVRELEYNLACAYVDGGIFTEAIVILERLYEKWPTEHRFGVVLANCYRSLRRSSDLLELTDTILKRREEEAVEARKEIQELGLDDPEKQAAEKETFEAMDDKEKEKYQKERQRLISRANPNFFWLLFQKAFAEFGDKNYDVALKLLEQLDTDFGSRQRALSLRGDIYLRKREWNSARQSYQEALELDAETFGPYLGMARAALGERKFEEAAELALTSLRFLFHQPQAHFLRGMALYRMDDFENAEASFRRTIEQAPLMAGAYRMMSEIARKHYKDPLVADTFREMAKDARKQARRIRDGKVGEIREASDANIAELEQLPTLLPRPKALAGVAESEIVTIVSGLPRSGTSLMMQILEALDFKPFTDGQREADASNEKGYYEHQLATQLLTSKEKGWLVDARGHALKLVAPHLRAVPKFVSGVADGKAGKMFYRLIYMTRPIDQVLASQKTMLERLGKKVPSGDVAKAYKQQEFSARRWTSRIGVPAIEVEFPELIANPEEQGRRILDFLGLKEDRLAKIIETVDPTLHRVK